MVALWYVFFSSVTILKCTFQYDVNSGHGLEGACGDDINLPNIKLIDSDQALTKCILASFYSLFQLQTGTQNRGTDSTGPVTGMTTVT